jgi:uncharacterized protein YkwD
MNAIRLKRYFFCAIFIFSALITTAKKTAAAGNPVIRANMENSILYYVNLHRRAIGRLPLQMNGLESSVAAQHSRDMAAGRTPFGHKDLETRFNTISRQLKSISHIGENVAYGQMSAKEVVDAWLTSPGHRRNIEGDFTLTGIGLARDRQGSLYYTQIFTR